MVPVEETRMENLDPRPALFPASIGRVEAAPVPATPDLIMQCYSRVEFYQPLYGITGLDQPLRPCRDRALAIEAALAPLGKSFSLIDFGSSLGYFPFFFADRGATALGLDINPENTEMAQACQRLTGIHATFATAPLDQDLVRAIRPGKFDVALILSVLHHLNLRLGLDYVQQLLAELLARVPVLVLELAHRDEEVNYAWRGALPEDPLAVLAACGPVRATLLGHFRSHLSASSRPLYHVTAA
jgi:O-antigen chain-terminating methyltransferase